MRRVITSVAAAAALFAAVGAIVSAQNPPPAAAAAAQKPAPPALGPNQWQIDSSHSAANFSVRHLMVSTVRGQLGRVSGTIEYDGKDVRSIKADVTIDVNGINTQNEKRDGHLRSADFFDVANHPAVTFKSKRVEPGANGAFKLVGDLTMRGTTKEVVLDVEAPSPIIKGRPRRGHGRQRHDQGQAPRVRSEVQRDHRSRPGGRRRGHDHDRSRDRPAGRARHRRLGHNQAR